MKDYITADQAAVRLGVPTAKVRQMIADGKLKTEKIGADELIAESEVNQVTRLEPPSGPVEPSTPPPINELAKLKISIETMDEGYLREVAVTQYESKRKQLAELQPDRDPAEIDKAVAAEIRKIKESNEKTPD